MVMEQCRAGFQIRRFFISQQLGLDAQLIVIAQSGRPSGRPYEGSDDGHGAVQGGFPNPPLFHFTTAWARCPAYRDRTIWTPFRASPRITLNTTIQEPILFTER
jgi:hypothetical protein